MAINSGLYMYDLEKIKETYKIGYVISRPGVTVKKITSIENDGITVISSTGRRNRIGFADLYRYNIHNTDIAVGSFARDIESGVYGYVSDIKDDKVKLIYNAGTREIQDIRTVSVGKSFCEVYPRAATHSGLKFKLKADISASLRYNRRFNEKAIRSLFQSPIECQAANLSNRVSNSDLFQINPVYLYLFYASNGGCVYLVDKDMEPYFPKKIRRIVVGDIVRYIGSKINVKNVQDMRFVVINITPNRSNINLDVITMGCSEMNFIQVYRKEIRRVQTITQIEHEKDNDFSSCSF